MKSVQIYMEHALRKALAEQIANPISYADDLTRDLVVDVELRSTFTSKSKMFQLVVLSIRV